MSIFRRDGHRKETLVGSSPEGAVSIVADTVDGIAAKTVVLTIMTDDLTIIIFDEESVTLHDVDTQFIVQGNLMGIVVDFFQVARLNNGLTLHQIAFAVRQTEAQLPIDLTKLPHLTTNVA